MPLNTSRPEGPPSPSEATKRPINKALRWLFGSLLFFMPQGSRRAYQRLAVRFMYPPRTPLRRYDGAWICLPRSETAKLFAGDPDHKRFNKNNYIPILRRAVREGAVIIDVGASYGDEVIDLARLAGPSGKVLALEPDPESFAALLDTTRLNGLDNVTCLQVAASDSHRPGAVTLDSLWRTKLAAGRVDFLKVDTDGHDLAVMRGAGEMLAANPGCVVLVEYLPALDYSGRSGPEVLHWYAGQGFEVQTIQPTARPLRPEDFRDFADRLGDPAESICHDVLLTRR